MDRAEAKNTAVYSYMGLLLILWGSFAAVSKIALRDLDSFQLQFYMFLSAATVMTVTMLLSGKMGLLAGLRRWELIRLAAFGLPSYCYYLFYTLALRLIPAVEASMLNYLFPIMIVIFAVPINREPFDARKGVSMLLGFLGTIMIITNGSIQNIRGTNLLGDFLAIMGAVSWGVFSNLGKRNNIDTTVSNYVYVLTSLVLSSVSLLLFSSPQLPGLVSGLSVSWLGISNIVLSYYLWFTILKAVSATLAASMSFITPFVTLLFIMLLTGEAVTWFQLLGLLVILAGVAIGRLPGSVPRARRSTSLPGGALPPKQ